MSRTTRLLILHARSPVHVGTGQSTAAVDLPIARDRATGFPLIPGSAIKGPLRARARNQEHRLSQEWQQLFGPETENASDHAGAVSFPDARLLLLPVRSVAGTFAWVSSPLLLSMLRRDAEQAGISIPKSPHLPDSSWTIVSKRSLLTLPDGGQKKVLLEDLDLLADDGADELGETLAELIFPQGEWRDLLKKRLCIVHDDVMSFLAQHATEVVTRVSIDPETGTAHDGQLWTEESLPAESVLAGLIAEVPSTRTRPDREGALLDRLAEELLSIPLQIGGKATVGRGRCRLQLQGGGAR